MPPKPRLRRVRKVLRVPKGGPINVRRAEFDAVIKLLNERGEIINDLREAYEVSHRELRGDLDVQFKRIAQIQAELDEIKRAWQKSTML